MKIKKITRDDGTKYLSADVNYNGERCPFCQSDNYYSGGSWSPPGCKDCGAVYFMGWIKDIEE
jgi:predicted Zn-ribbon and HTH transcriptional regulator